MSRQFLTSIDLAKNEFQNAAAHNLAAAPSTPVKGQLYMNTTDNTLYWWDGTTWQSAKAGASFPGYGAVITETAFGQAANNGAATTVARSDHTHGSPAHGNAEHTTIPLSTFAAPTANIPMAGFKFTGLPDPTATGDVANKNYVDNAIEGLSWKDAVRVATPGAITLSGTQTVDGVALAVGDRVLVRNQSTNEVNGIYTVASGAWPRAIDMDEPDEFPSAAVFVMQGTTLGETAWTCSTDPPVVIGTTPIFWNQFASSVGSIPPTRQVIAGAGLTGGGALSADVTLNVVGDASITVAADAITRAALTGDVTAAAGSNATTIANDVVTNAKLANMAQATIKGRQNTSTGDPEDLTPVQAAAIIAQGGVFMRMAALTVGGATSQAFAHGLNTRDVLVNVYRNSTPWDEVDCDIEHTDANTVTVRFAVAPAASAFRVVVHG